MQDTNRRDGTDDPAPASRLERIERELLEAPVQKALGASDVMVSEWAYRVVKGDWTPPKGIVCRIFGRATQGTQEVPWSLFLKIPSPTEDHPDVLRREPFHRELLLYQSGVLNSIPGAISAPRLLGVIEQTDDELWMWLEDVAGEESLNWPVERFGLAARHLGILQGAVLDGAALPDGDWIDTSGWLRPKLARRFAQIAPMIERFKTHPLTGSLCESQIGQRFLQTWAERETFVGALDRMPLSLCHGDFCYPNLFSRRGPDGSDQTVAVDWQYSGLRQIGGDIAGLIADSSVLHVRRKAAEQEEFTELVLEGYLAGLREGGWKGNSVIARFACIATLAMPWSLNVLSALDSSIARLEGCQEQDQLAQALEAFIRRQTFLQELAAEARATLEPAVRAAQAARDRRR